MSTEKLSESRRRALTGEPSRDGLKPLTYSRGALRRAVEEAEWLGDEERAEQYKNDLAVVEAKIIRGEMWDVSW